MAENGDVTAAVAAAAREIEELSRTIVRRLVKDKPSRLSTESEVSLFSESEGCRGQLYCPSPKALASSSTISPPRSANDVCKESNRQIINAEDVLKALEEIDFPEFIQTLRDSLEGLCLFFINAVASDYYFLMVELGICLFFHLVMLCQYAMWSKAAFL